MPINQRIAGFINATYQPLKVANAPTVGTATGGDAQASVAFTAPGNVGGSAITAYYAVSNPSQITATAASSPITVTGLTNGTAYTFTVWALNSYGPSPYSGASNSVTPALLQRGVFGGGSSNVMDYIDISSTGNAIDFGDMLASTRLYGSFSSKTRGVFAGGNDSLNVIQYITFSTTGNSTNFGNLTKNMANGLGGCSSETRGIVGGGIYSGTFNAVLNYVTIATTGNALTFGDLTSARYGVSACASTTRGVFGGGENSGGFSNIIDYITISSTGNATDFGDLLNVARDTAACSSSTRGLWAGNLTEPGSEPFSNVIQYITISSTGNATDFGDLTQVSVNLAACSSSTRGTFGGGLTSGPANTNVISYVTISSTGNATDFGDLTTARSQLGACSSAHGGL